MNSETRLERENTMDREQLFKRLATARAFTMQALTGLTEEQWTSIPEGFSNNLLWNAGHIAATQSRLLYTLSGLPLPMPVELVEMTGRGSSPKDWPVPPNPEKVMGVLEQLVPQVIEDNRADKFTQFTPVELRPGVSVDSFDDAVLFCILHEGIHIGMIMALKKLVK